MKKRRCSSPVESNDEMEVVSILLQFPHLIRLDEQLKTKNTTPSFIPSWTTKRKRSIDGDNLTQQQRRLSIQSPPPTVTTTSPPPPVQEIELKKPAVKGEAASPTTPFSFCHSEPDEKKSKRLKRKLSVKKTREQLVETIQGYTQNNELLTKEIEQAKRYYKQLKECNLWLQTRKHELSIGNIRREKCQVEVKASTGLTLEVKPATAIDQDVHLTVDKGPFVIEAMANKAEVRSSYQHPCAKNMSLQSTASGLLGMNENVGSSGIPDLNVSPTATAGESFRMELRHQQRRPVDNMNKSFAKAMAAQARQRRMQICRDKTSSSTSIRFRLLHR